MEAKRFTDEEPTSDFVWLFENRDGSVDECPTTLADYLKYRSLYGVPATRWRDA